MRYYLIRDTHVTALATPPVVVPDDSIVIDTIKSLDARRFPLSRLIAIWNAFPDARSVKHFKDRTVAIKRIWTALEALPLKTSRTDSKQSHLIGLMQRPEGASMEVLMKATGWQRHSIRGLLSGTLRKKMGLTVSQSLEGDTRIYRIAA